jgi:hypothetical protein
MHEQFCKKMGIVTVIMSDTQSIHQFIRPLHSLSPGSMVIDHQPTDLCPKLSYSHNHTTGYHFHGHSFYNKNDRENLTHKFITPG